MPAGASSRCCWLIANSRTYYGATPLDERDTLSQEPKDKTSRQIVFEGERLDMQAVWKAARPVLPAPARCDAAGARKKIVPSKPIGGLPGQPVGCHAFQNIRTFLLVESRKFA